MPEWNVLIAVLIALGITSRLARWPRWKKEREEKITEILEVWPNLHFRWIFWTGVIIMFTELSIFALSFWYIYYLLN